MAIFVAAIGFWAKHTRSRAAKPHRFFFCARPRYPQATVEITRLFGLGIKSICERREHSGQS